MKWLMVSNSRSLLSEYHLMHNDVCLAVLKYNPVHHSVRLSAQDIHELYFIESTGALTGKYIFHNEYNMETGHMYHDKWYGKSGVVVIESKKYHYQVTDAQLSIAQPGSLHTTINCEWNNAETTAQKSIGDENNFLLLGLCWYLCLPVIKNVPAALAV